jgi:hypothetical protein
LSGRAAIPADVESPNGSHFLPRELIQISTALAGCEHHYTSHWISSMRVKDTG